MTTSFHWIEKAEAHPTITYHQQLAAELMESLDQFAARIPGLEGAHESKMDFVRSHVNVPFEFLGSAIAAVEQTPELQAGHRLDVDDARDALQFIAAFRPAADKLALILGMLRFTLASRKAGLAAEALQIYSLAKGYARDPQGAEIGNHVANMRRDLGRSGRPRTRRAP
jgi:hypothetical protein